MFDEELKKQMYEFATCSTKKEETSTFNDGGEMETEEQIRTHYSKDQARASLCSWPA